jgi:nitroreductase
VIAALLDKQEYRPGELSGFYSVFGLGAAMENLWLTTTELGMGIQFISFPMEVPHQWDRLVEFLEVPDDLELMALYRVGYVDEDAARPPIDWSSRHRKRRSDFVFRNTCATPEPDGPTADPTDARIDDHHDPSPSPSPSESVTG